MFNRRAMFCALAAAVLGGAAAMAQPAAPSNLVAQAVRDDRVNLLFQDNSNNETQFEVEVRPSGSSGFIPVGSFGSNVTALSVTALQPNTQYAFRVRALNGAGPSPYSNVASATTLSTDDSCTPTPSAMCLNNNRFRVQALFLAPNGPGGEAGTVELTVDSGYMWFFNTANIEAIVKVLNGCGVNARYWAFAGGLTNVSVLLTVTDTAHHVSSTYFNPQGVAFQPIQDTGAFATCP